MLFIYHESFIDIFKLLLHLFSYSSKFWANFLFLEGIDGGECCHIVGANFPSLLRCCHLVLRCDISFGSHHVSTYIYIYILSFCRLKQTGLQTMTVCIYCSSVCSAFHDFRALAHVSFPVAGMLSFSECKKEKKKKCTY